jgi:hypothetical protein
MNVGKMILSMFLGNLIFDSFQHLFRNAIVLERFYMMLKMESTMWILSTLGGGFSAMADCGLRKCVSSYFFEILNSFNLGRDCACNFQKAAETCTFYW